MMYNMFFVICHFAMNNNASDKDTGVIEEIEFPDFSSFMGNFCKYKKDL